MITSPLFFPCRLLKERRDDLVGTTMFMAFLLRGSESRVPILSAVPLTNLNALKSLPPHYGTEHQLFGVKCFWRGATKTGRKQKRNQPAGISSGATTVASPQRLNDTIKAPEPFVQGAQKDHKKIVTQIRGVLELFQWYHLVTKCPKCFLYQGSEQLCPRMELHGLGLTARRRKVAGNRYIIFWG